MAVDRTKGVTLREIAHRIRMPGVCGYCGDDAPDGHLGNRLGETTVVCPDCCTCST